MFEKQTQSASDGSWAVQAAGNVTVIQHGVSAAGVRELVEVFVQQQLPMMREEARRIAQANAARFCEEFVRQVASSQKVSEQEFSRPDTQASFHAALSGVAMRGEEADLELVVAALVRRLEAADEPLIKQVLESAIDVLPRLTRPQISFLAFVQYAKHVRHTSARTLDQLELMASEVLPFVEPGLNLSRANQLYLAGLGLLTVNPVANASLFHSQLTQAHPFFPKSLKDLQAQNCQNLVRMLEAFDAVEAPQVFLTVSGMAVALLQLRRVFGDLDLSIWIN